MINVVTLKNAVVSGLHRHTGRPVVMLEQAKKKPDYPFLGYKITTPYSPENGLPSETWEVVPSNEPGFKEDVKYTQSEQPQLTFSLTAYCKDDDKSLELALQAHAWFSYLGLDYLKENNLVVVEVTPVQNRDTMIVDDYERRQGFDVIFRTASKLTKIITNIEQAELDREE